MADVTRSTNDLFYGPATLLVDAYVSGGEATSRVGFKQRSAGFTVRQPRTQVGHKTEEYEGDVIARNTARGLEVECVLEQWLEAAIAQVFGISASSMKIGGGFRAVDEYMARVIGSTVNHRPIHLKMPKCVTMGDIEFTVPIDEEDPAGLMLTLKSLDGAQALGQWMIGQTASQAVTIATGTATVTKTSALKTIAHVILSAESGAADDLDDVAGSVAYAAADDGHVVRVQAASGDTITVKNASGTLETKSGSDVILSDTNHWFDMYWDNSETAWKELDHFNGA